MVKLLKSPLIKPLVSVIFPIYNSDKFLRESLESLLKQTYQNFEIIAINDGSQDQSRQIISSYKDSRIKYYEHKKNLGLVNTLNEGIKLSRGKYIARMDADDISSKNRLKTQVNYLEAHKDIDILGSWIKNFGRYNYIWRVHKSHAYITTKLLFETSIAHPTVMLRADSVRQSKVKFEERYHSAEDYMFWSKLSELNLRFANIDMPLLKYRTHPSQVGEADKSRQQLSSKKVRLYNISRLGLKPTTREMNLHQKLSSWVPLSGFDEVVTTGRWLSKMLLANSMRKVYDSQALSTVIGEKWVVICYLSSASNIIRMIYLLTTPKLLLISVKTLYLRITGKLYENS